MYLSILRLWNFRKYAGADNKPGLEIHFQKGVNVLIGENDSGKTAIVDAIRYVLRTQSGEFIQFEDKDFYQDSDGNRKDEFKINSAFPVAPSQAVRRERITAVQMVGKPFSEHQLRRSVLLAPFPPTSPTGRSRFRHPPFRRFRHTPFPTDKHRFIFPL